MADEDDLYEHVSGGGLKIKGGNVNKSKKKKKKKRKNKAEEIVEQATTSKETQDNEEEEKEEEETRITKTTAELAFEKAQEKRAAERILKKASKTHKQRVEELNEYLGGLSEHYDIQKVSWTK